MREESEEASTGEGKELPGEDKQQNQLLTLAARLLEEWATLKEVFRIPKKERIEQMKEHEREAAHRVAEELRGQFIDADQLIGCMKTVFLKAPSRVASFKSEAPNVPLLPAPVVTSFDTGDKGSKRQVVDRGYKEYLDREEHHDKQSYDRHWRRPEHDRPRNKRSRESPDPDRNRKGSRYEDRTIIPIPRISKEERRHLFAMKVEEEERQRREQDELWRHHEERCMALGVDPQLTAAFDPQTGYPCFFDHTQGIWQAYPPPQDPSTIPPGAVPPEIRPSPLYTPSPHIPPNNPHGVIPSTHLLPGDYGTNNPHIPPLPYDPPPQPHLQPGYMDPLLPEFIPLPSGPQPQPQSLYAPLPQTLVPPQPPLPPVKLPPKWKAAKDSEGRTYYYHVKTRLSQWEFPVWPDDLTAQQETDSSSGSSDEDDDEEDDEEEESSSEEDDELDKGEDDDDEDDDEEIADEVKEDKRESSIVNSLSIPSSISPLSIPLPAMELSPVPQEDISLEDEELQKKERRREGLVQERIISPRRDEDRTDMKKYREIKEKLRRKKEQVRAKEKKKQRHRDTKQHSEKPVTVAADTSSNTERKIKDHFRLQMAGVIVQYLNPYRKPDCKKGRITNTEDFKYLARRLTHFVMIKELRHCCSVVDDLECNDNVKHKARDFIKKYMAKFGATYQRPPEKKTHI
uniref:WW domain-containing protein n=1 Tax=Timema shepardi TaxID=629360 RepID=A0A7R9FXJ6_TIMSH|nr:unnamed protein product [Timema shepardi]